MTLTPLAGGYQLDFSWVPDNLPLFLDAAWLTIRLMAGSAVVMVVLGVLAGQGLSSRRAWVRAPVRVYVDSGDSGDSQDGRADTATLAQAYRTRGANLDYVMQAGARRETIFSRL